MNGSEKRSGLIEPDLFHPVISTRLRDQIKDQLSRQAPTAATMFTLNDLASRITQAPLQYRDLYPYAIDWYHAILNNPSVPRDMHVATIIHLFEISTAVGDHATALDAVVTARLYDPADASYALMEADARIALHQLERAEEILLQIKRSPSHSSADTMNDVDLLLTRIRAMRADHAKP